MRHLCLLVLLGLAMANPNGQTYFVRLVKLDGTYVGGTTESSGAVLVEPMPIESVSFTDVAFVPDQSGAGAFTIKLREGAQYQQLYALINYYQRVEVFDNYEMLGDPAFTGVVRQLPIDLARNEVSGVGIIGRLDERRLRRYDLLTGNAATLMRSLLKTYQPIFTDNFNRASIGADWTYTPGDWDISGNVLRPLNTSSSIRTATTYAAAVWDNAKVSVDFYLPTPSGYPATLNCINVSQAFRLIFGLYFATDATSQNLQARLLGDNSIEIARRDAIIAFDTWHHIDIYSIMTATGRRLIVDINGVQYFDIIDTGGTSVAGFFYTNTLDLSERWDNVVLAQSTTVLTAGTIDVSTTTVNQQFNGDTNKSALDLLIKNEQWEYRTNPKVGAGNDTIDIGLTVGRDLSSVLTLEEGKNIESITRDNSADGLSTWLTIYPQDNDEEANGFISVDIDAIADYGIIDSDLSDPRVIDSATAKTIGDIYLSQAVNGKVSLSGRVIDESWLYQQDPRIGYLIIGDSVIGGRQRLRAGDWVWLKSTKCNVDKKVKIVALTRTSGDPGIELVFDYFRLDRTTRERRSQETLFNQVRAWRDRMTITSARFIFSGAVTLAWSPTLRGNLAKILLDACSNAWGGMSVTTIEIDTVDRTAALGGPWTANFHVDLTTYLNLPGEHTIELTTDGAVTIDCGLVSRLIG